MDITTFVNQSTHTLEIKTNQDCFFFGSQLLNNFIKNKMLTCFRKDGDLLLKNQVLLHISSMGKEANKLYENIRLIAKLSGILTLAKCYKTMAKDKIIIGKSISENEELKILEQASLNLGGVDLSPEYPSENIMSIEFTEFKKTEADLKFKKTDDSYGIYGDFYPQDLSSLPQQARYLWPSFLQGKFPSIEFKSYVSK